MGLFSLFRRRQAVRDSIDNLPLGLCFFAPDGLVLLKNRTADRLCERMCGRKLVNGLSFAESLAGMGAALRAESVSARHVLGPGTAFLAASGLERWPRSWRLEDGRIWTFSLSKLDVDGEDVYELSASDTTALFEANAELADDTRRLSSMNMRLRRYARDVVDLARSSEILEAKVRIHDELGQALLLTRRSLLGQERADVESLLDTWEFCVGVLHRKNDLAVRAANFDQIVAAGKAVGVEVEVEGALDDARAEVLRLIDLTASECLINAVRHAGARSMRIAVSVRDGWTQARFSNDGRLPQGPFKEGGGLSGLRASIEEAGGTMEIGTAPVFVVTIRLPQESEEY